MSKQLFIYLGPEAPELVGWATRDQSGRLETGDGPLARVPRTPGDRLVVMVPGAEVLITEVEIPGRRRRLRRQSLPYLLEENLVDEVEELHFASGPPTPEGRLPVATVARARLTHWLALLAEGGLVAELLVPTTMAVPVTPGQWTLLLSGEDFLARHGNWQLAGGEAANLGYYLAPVKGNLTAATAARIFDCNAASPLPQMAGLTVSSTTPAQFLAVLAEGFNSSPYFNLLQGEFARGARWLDILRRWRLPLAGVLLLAILAGTSLALDYLHLRREATRLTREISATYLQTFPGSRVVNAQVQMEQKLAELRGVARRQSTFFTLYDKMAPLAASNPGFGLETLRFQNNRLELELNIADLQDLEKLKTNLGLVPELSAEIRNAESVGGRVRARLVVEGRN